MNKPVEMISLPAGDLLRGVSAESLARALLDRVAATPTTTAPATTAALPPIGTERDGEIYAGLTIADNVPVALWLLPGEERLTWAEAVAWAEKQGGVLPSRIDQLVLIQNLREQFKPEWYWSGEQCAPYSGYAWSQIFYGGYQDSYHKYSIGRARAVRRSVIQ